MLLAQAGRLSREPRAELGGVDDRSPADERLRVEVRIADQLRRQGPEPPAREPCPSRPRSRPRHVEALQLLVGAGRGHDFDLEAVAQKLPGTQLADVRVVPAENDDARPRGHDASPSSSSSPHLKPMPWYRSAGTARVTIATATNATAATHAATTSESRSRYAAPTATPAARATFHADRRFGAPAGFVRRRAIQRKKASAVSAATATQAAASAPPEGMNTSPRAMTSDERQAVGDGHRPLRSACDQPELPGLDEEDGDQRQRLDPQHGHGADVLLTTDKANPRLGQDGDSDHEQRCDHKRRLGHALERAPESRVVLVAGDREQRQRDREDERRQAEQHLEDPERGAEEAGLTSVESSETSTTSTRK